ncbi:MAG TPA: hypothetical protein VFJ57_01805 [Solirubrobacterales bacterium]|nr:hypothetical protein [Solirubrobacterales bacterium]
MLPFWLSIGALSLVQGALVAAPRAVTWAPLERLRNRWLALILPLSIAVVVAAIAAESAVADFLTYLALVAVPPLAAVALAWLVRGARPPLALLVLPLFALAWAAKGDLSGQTAALALSALACVSLGWLLASVVPERWLELGIYAMAAIDAYLVGTDLLQTPNAVLNTASPGAGLPRLQFVHFGSAVMGFGDVFIAAVLGAMLARDRRLQLTGAAIAAVIGISFDFLFFAVDELPATVPIALTLAVLELWGRCRPRAASQPESSSRQTRRGWPR